MTRNNASDWLGHILKVATSQDGCTNNDKQGDAALPGMFTNFTCANMLVMILPPRGTTPSNPIRGKKEQQMNQF